MFENVISKDINSQFDLWSILGRESFRIYWNDYCLPDVRVECALTQKMYSIFNSTEQWALGFLEYVAPQEECYCYCSTPKWTPQQRQGNKVGRDSGWREKRIVFLNLDKILCELLGITKHSVILRTTERTNWNPSVWPVRQESEHSVPFQSVLCTRRSYHLQAYKMSTMVQW